MYIHPPPKINVAQLLKSLGADDTPNVSMPTDEKGRYLHWDDLRHRPLMTGFKNQEAYWGRLKLTRLGKSSILPFRDKNKRLFWFCADALQRAVHKLDQRAAGNVGTTTENAFNSPSKPRHIINGLIDEAIHSSQLEGASTTYVHAKEMLRHHQQPQGLDERMIYNNYLAMQRVNEDFCKAPLTLEMIKELHSILTDGILKEDARGRLRDKDEDDHHFGVYDEKGGLLHQPPPWRELHPFMQTLCDFANDDSSDPDKPFVHPLLRAMILHFMLAYAHPFIDGNGRTARGLFYWALARHNYWLALYAPISAVIKRTKAKYKRAFLLSESDQDGGFKLGCDITYFLAYHTDVLTRAMDNLDKRITEQIEIESKIQDNLRKARIRGNWNFRQLALLKNAVKQSNGEYTADSHANSHVVSKQTALTDMNELVKAGLLKKHRRGKRFVYVAAASLRRRLGNG